MLYIIGICTHADVVRSILNIPSESITFEVFKDRLHTFTANDRFICALGDNAKRHKTYTQAKDILDPQQWINAIHASAIVASDVKLGYGNVICAGAVIQTQAEIGNHCIINTHSSVDHHGKLADFVHIAPNVAICGSVHIGEGTFVGTSSSVMPNLILSPWSFIKAGTLVKYSSGPIPIYRPYIKSQFANCANMVLNVGALTSQTPHCSFVAKSESLLAKIFDVKFVMLVNNGTSATHCLYLALRYKYPHIKKIYVPNHVYVAVWNTALYEYDSQQLEVLPVDPTTLNMPESDEFINGLEQNSALVIVHNVGNIINVPRIQSLRPDLVLVEDNCEGLFGKYESFFTGTKSLCSSCSFFANKTITCGEGGAFMTNDEDVFQFIKKSCNQGITTERYVHDVIGYNYRITNIQAAVLYPQIVERDTILDKKRYILDEYRRLVQHPNVEFVSSNPHTQHANWIIIIRIKGSAYPVTCKWFSDRYIETRPFFYDIHRHKHLCNVPKHNEQVPLRSEELVMFPSYPDLELPVIQYIARCINEFANLFTQ
jgi:perosamine synthetase